jgi:superfamily I DNA/RNA helicase
LYEEQQALAYDFHRRMLEQKIDRRSPQYLDAMLNDPYMNVLQVKYGYALTCHKAQGGEWDTAIVDLEGKFFYKNEASYRWMYTAMTRARKRLWFIGTVPFTAMDWLD